MTPPGIEVLDGRKLGPSDVMQSVRQDALDGAAVEHFEVLKIHAKSFQSPEGE